MRMATITARQAAVEARGLQCLHVPPFNTVTSFLPRATVRRQQTILHVNFTLLGKLLVMEDTGRVLREKG
jgi:hypothetical protein